MLSEIEKYLNPDEIAVFTSLDTPAKIQAFLDATPYSPEMRNRSVPSVMRDQLAHCLDGALFAAAALRNLGYPPLIIDMLPQTGTDDDHLIAIYKRNGCYGAVAKSNFSGLRSREPIYRTTRELVLSYFEWFFNLNGMKTLRGYTRPFLLATYDHLNWMWQDSGVDAIEKRLYSLKTKPLMNASMAANLNSVDKLTYEAGMLGVNPAGLFQPKS